MAKFLCRVCEYSYDEQKKGTVWDDLPDDWLCPVCESGKSQYDLVDTGGSAVGTTGAPAVPDAPSGAAADSIDDLLRESDELERHMADIHQMAETGESVIEPMRTRRPAISWDDILIKGAQLASLPLNPEEEVNTRTVIGPGAKQPLVMESPVYVTHMSFGALSREAKIALSRGSAAA
jgi:methylamine---glutamate N-methyltransferase subunit C